ncbi:hypothetical protein Scep_030779 [Stephania cephalantha]|uniref:Uncharacterized protein n=1 Tax=Stephania cephalantha TaxID=152367 RepID=A0AAP0E835_9MAGN
MKGNCVYKSMEDNSFGGSGWERYLTQISHTLKLELRDNLEEDEFIKLTKQD